MPVLDSEHNDFREEAELKTEYAENDASNNANHQSMLVLHMPFWTQPTFNFCGRRIWLSKLHNLVVIVEQAFLRPPLSPSPSHTKRATPGVNDFCDLLLSPNPPMAQPLSRVKREQLRKRRNNLLRRHNEFWLLYGIKTWLIMEQPDGQVFTYHSHPYLPQPSREEIQKRSAVNKTPRDYAVSAQPAETRQPVISSLAHSSDAWKALEEHLQKNRFGIRSTRSAL
ncbi:hypothetical protein N7494_006956 [Penicillium frequentans]|uniref:MADS-box domain-containing protein n=1 Tax=Penicillium frequentans TaxID=3151616 RepID=A0AAD6GE86_9EURO|nr:hypothetical protein N7494_006956 [Penicillium glabrum]